MIAWQYHLVTVVKSSRHTHTHTHIQDPTHSRFGASAVYKTRFPSKKSGILKLAESATLLRVLVMIVLRRYRKQHHGFRPSTRPSIIWLASITKKMKNIRRRVEQAKLFLSSSKTWLEWKLSDSVAGQISQHPTSQSKPPMSKKDEFFTWPTFCAVGRALALAHVVHVQSN